MKTPQNLEREEQRAKEEQQAKDRQETWVVRKTLEIIMENAKKDRTVDSRGGTIEYSDIKEENVAVVVEYFRQYGWSCTYVPEKWKKGFLEGVNNYFKISPLKNLK